MDVAVLEWCKLFADHRDPHCWRRIVRDTDSFEENLYGVLGAEVTAQQFADYCHNVRRYRDKFVAHLDDEPIAHIPSLSYAISSAFYYHGHVVEAEAEDGDLLGLPTDLVEFYERNLDEATSVYRGET